MAGSLSQFQLDDDSPEIAYFPFVNLEPSANLSAGWQLLYSGSGAATGPGQVGVGTSYHYTSLNGASLLINWNGMGIDLVGSVGNARYNISLDGAPATYLPDPADSILVSFNDLENTNHSLLLTTVITNATSPDAFLVFDSALITYAPPAGLVNTTATSQAIADADIAFMGMWNYIADAAGNAMHMSNSAGDRAEITFQGSAITIYGLTSSYSGNFTVTLDNTTTSLSALSSYNNSDTLLFYATDLSQDIPHQIVVINQENRTLALRVGGVNVTSFVNSTTNPTTSSASSHANTLPAGTIAAIALAVILFLVVVSIVCYVCCVRRKARGATGRPTFLQDARTQSNYRGDADVEEVANISPPSGEELESTSLSTGKGYGFGLGLRRGFPFAYRKNKAGSDSSERSRNETAALAESHLMTSQPDRDEKQRFSVNTLTEMLPILAHAPESEKLAPGWSNPVARTPPSFRYNSCYKAAPDIVLPGLCVSREGPVDDDNDDDADVKTLTSRQDEALAATLLLSPRTSEALPALDGATRPKPSTDAQDDVRHSHEDQHPELLQVRETSAFRVDLSGIFGPRRSNRDSRRTSGSSNSTWSKVRARLYRRAHRDDGRQSHHADKQETSGSSGPESVPVVMHQSGSANPSEAAHGSGTYSFLDLTSSHVSLRRYSKATTLSSTPAELGHEVREVSAWGESAPARIVRFERSRDGTVAPKPDAPSTASGGSHPSDNSGPHTAPSPPTTYTQAPPTFPFPATVTPSTHMAQPSNQVPVPERHITPPPPPPPSPPPPHTSLPEPEQYLQIPQIAPPELASPTAGSPTESVPFSVSDIHFRHSFSDYNSQRASVASVLPPHPPLPPPYIVQRVLGLPTSPLTPHPLRVASRVTPDVAADGASHAGRPGITTIQVGRPLRVGSLLGPRPRPSTEGSVRGSAAPQLPMQGGRSGLRSRR